MERAPCPIVKMVLTGPRDTSCHLRSLRLAWRLKRRPIGDDGPRALYLGIELDSVSEVHAVAALERWRNHYAGYRVLHLSDGSAIPQLCTCFDEPVARIESTGPRLLRYLWGAVYRCPMQGLIRLINRPARLNSASGGDPSAEALLRHPWRRYTERTPETTRWLVHGNTLPLIHRDRIELCRNDPSRAACKRPHHFPQFGTLAMPLVAGRAWGKKGNVAVRAPEPAPWWGVLGTGRS